MEPDNLSIHLSKHRQLPNKVKERRAEEEIVTVTGSGNSGQKGHLWTSLTQLLIGYLTNVTVVQWKHHTDETNGGHYKGNGGEGVAPYHCFGGFFLFMGSPFLHTFVLCGEDLCIYNDWLVWHQMLWFQAILWLRCTVFVYSTSDGHTSHIYNTETVGFFSRQMNLANFTIMIKCLIELFVIIHKIHCSLDSFRQNI